MPPKRSVNISIDVVGIDGNQKTKLENEIDIEIKKVIKLFKCDHKKAKISKPKITTAKTTKGMTTEAPTAKAVKVKAVKARAATATKAAKAAKAEKVPLKKKAPGAKKQQSSKSAAMLARMSGPKAEKLPAGSEKWTKKQLEEAMKSVITGGLPAEYSFIIHAYKKGNKWKAIVYNSEFNKVESASFDEKPNTSDLEDRFEKDIDNYFRDAAIDLPDYNEDEDTAEIMYFIDKS